MTDKEKLNMKAIRDSWSNIIICLLEILVGILLLIDPVGFTAGIVVALGIALLIGGIVSIVGYCRAGAREAAAGRGLVRGLTALAAGAFCAFNSGWFVAAFPVLTILYGLGVLIAGFFKVQTTFDVIRLGGKRWGWMAAGAALSILAAVIILSNPFGSTVVLWRFTAIMLIAESALDVVALFMSHRRQDRPEEQL